eukprot:c28947_g1_i4 orf=169-2988(+)
MARDSDDRRWRRQNVGSVEDLDSSKALFEPGTSEQKRDLVKDPDTIPTERAELENINDDNALLDKIEKPNTLFRSCQSVSFDPLDDQIEGFVDEEQLGKENNSSTEHAGKVLLSLSTAKQSGGVPMLKGRRGSTSYGKEGSPETSNVSGSDGEQSDGANQAGVIDDLEGIRHETMKKFIKFISDANGKLEKGWEVEINRRYGRINKFFISPKKQRFRSRIEVAKFLGLHKTGQKLVQRKMPSSVHQESNAGLNQDNSAIIGNRQDLQLVPLVVNGSIEGGTDQGNAFSVPTSYRGKDFIPAKFNDKEKDFVNLEKGNQMRSEEGQRLDKNDTTDTKKAQPSPFVVSQRCQDVLRHIVSADKFAALCNMFHGVPAGFWDKGFQAKAPALVTGALNFQLVTTRMAAGAYGETPEMFIADLQQVWKNIHLVGNELILLADSLSKLSYRLYNEQVLTLLPEAEGREKSDGIGPLQENLSGEQTSPIHTHEPGQQPIDMSGHSSEEGVALKESGADDPSIRGDGEKDHFSDAGDAEKQSKSQVVLSLHALEVVESSLQPPLAVKNMQKSGARLQRTSVPKSKQTLKTASDESICKVCSLRDDDNLIVCRLCKVRYHINCLEAPLPNIPENVWCCHICAQSATDNYPGIKRSDQTGEIVSCDAQELPLVVEQKDKHAEHTSVKEIQEPSEAILKDGLCKICAKDDQQVRLCDSCDSAYHIHCLIPGLDEAPDGNWLCPMCNADGKKQVDLVSLHDIGYPVDAKHTLESSQPCAGSEQNGERAVVPVESNVVEYPATVAMDRICKVCGAGEDERLIICCDACAVYYHVSCLKPPLKKVPSATWYCPSCLCRVCKVDIDDDKILLCDACDEGYHTYCLSPPLQNIPEGCWYCPSCAVNEVLAGKTLVTRDSTIVASTVNSKMPTEELDRRELSKRKRKRADPKRATR